ncbi:MAG: hypothetical protein ACLVLA_12465 [Acidaminococcus intestini]
MALGKRNNGNFRLSSVEVGAPRIWIHLNRIRKKQMEEKIGTGHSLHDVVSLQLFSSHLNQSEPHSNHVNRRKTRTHGAKLPLLIHHQKDLPSALQNQVAFGPPPGKAERLSPSLRQKDRNVSPEPNVDTNSVQGFLGYISYGS